MNDDEGELVYKSFRLKRQPFAAPFTVLETLDHGVPMQPLREPLRVTACCFGHNDDSCLITQTSFNGNTNRVFQAGFVQIWDLLSEENDVDYDSLFTYSPVPKFSLSFDGKIIASILNSGQGMIYLIEKIDNEYPRLDPCKFDCFSMSKEVENVNGRPSCCVFSPDGCYVVIVSAIPTAQAQIQDLSLWRVSSSKVLTKVSKVICESALNGFSGRVYNCEFSLDGNFIALSTTHGQLYALNTPTLEVDSILQSVAMENNTCMCVFLPDATLAGCTSDGMFYLWSLYPRQLVCHQRIIHSSSKVTAMMHNQDYTAIAFGTSEGKVAVYCTDLFHHLYTIIDPKDDDVNDDFHLEVCSLAFSKSCHEMAVGYNDGCVRIWQLPVQMNLQHLCRMEILRIVLERNVGQLPIPLSLKAYLLFKTRFRSYRTAKALN